MDNPAVEYRCEACSFTTGDFTVAFDHFQATAHAIDDFCVAPACYASPHPAHWSGSAPEDDREPIQLGDYHYYNPRTA